MIPSKFIYNRAVAVLCESISHGKYLHINYNNNREKKADNLHLSLLLMPSHMHRVSALRTSLLYTANELSSIHHDFSDL